MGASGTVSGVLGAGRECRYLGARRGIGSIRGHWAPRVSGVYLGTGRECRYSGTRRGIGGIRGHWGLLGDVEGITGCQGVLGADRECSTQGPEGV